MIHMKTHLTALLTLVFTATTALAQSTAFTYQGRLTDATGPAHGTYDLRFSAWDAASGPAQVGGSVTNAATAVSNGLFTVTLDLGTAVFTGAQRWLEIAVRTNGGGSFSTLTPRQPVTSTPYAVLAANAATAAAVASGAVGAAALQASAVDSSKISDGTIALADLSPAVASNTFWRLTGNAGTTPGTHFIGTTDNQPLELRASNTRILRLEPNVNSPNLIGGFPGNLVSNGVVGAVIAGGGLTGNTNRVGGSYSTVSGGYNNAATLGSATVAGGDNNLAGQDRATVGGGFNNRAVGLLSTVAGGDGNVASGIYSTAPGGSHNVAGGSYSLAAGRRAKANHTGAFVWADSTPADFASTASDQFCVRAHGGVQLDPLTSFYFGANLRQMLNLWTAEYGLGVQANTLYQRSGGGFAWFRGGTHDNGLGNPGTGGTNLMALDGNGELSLYASLTLDTVNANSGGLRPGLVFGFGSGEGIASRRSVGANQYGLDFFTSSQARLSIANNGSIGIGTTTPTDARLDLEGALRMNDNEIFLRSGTERGHGLGYRTTVNGLGVDGPFLYGFNGGALGVGGPDTISLRWDWLGNTWVSNNLTASSMDIRSGTLGFSTQMRQMLNLWNAEYGIGIQSSTEYFRTGPGGGFAWFKGGSHNDAQNNPGSGGTTLMRLDSGGNLFTTGAVNPPSDRHVKRDFVPVDGREILERLARVPVQTWSYTNDVAGTRHVGPMAQDFHAAFGLGTDDKHIATVDADGVALAAIQGLNQKLEEQLRQKDVELKSQQEQIAELLTRLSALEGKLHTTAKK
jgi:hypothetical protein